jgi:hypothetical protein
VAAKQWQATYCPLVCLVIAIKVAKSYLSGIERGTTGLKSVSRRSRIGLINKGVIMKVKLTATRNIESFIENGSIVGFNCTKPKIFDGFVEVKLENLTDFYKLICDLSTENSLIISSADESECDIEIYNDYRE